MISKIKLSSNFKPNQLPRMPWNLFRGGEVGAEGDRDFVHPSNSLFQNNRCGSKIEVRRKQ